MAFKAVFELLYAVYMLMIFLLLMRLGGQVKHLLSKLLELVSAREGISDCYYSKDIGLVW